MDNFDPTTLLTWSKLLTYGGLFAATFAITALLKIKLNWNAKYMALCIGVVLSICAYYFAAVGHNASEFAAALLRGIFAGISATGTDQHVAGTGSGTSTG